MKADRVIGLHKTEQFKRYTDLSGRTLTQSPVHWRNQLLYPFLVIEAKREESAPGFRHIEAQTAFPIRRFLRIQEALRADSSQELDPLVWFFAFQGDEWRLYAAILDGNKVVST